MRDCAGNDGFGNIAGRAVAFFAIPFYARFLSPAQYGLIELIELSTQTIAIAVGLQAIGTALIRLFHDQTSAEAERNVVSTALIGTALLSGCVTVISVAAAGSISRAVFNTDAWTTLLQAAFVAMCFASIVEVVLVYERMRDNVRFYLGYSLITLVLSLGLNIIFIGVLDTGVWGFVFSKLIVSIGGMALLLWRLRRDVGWHWRGVYVPEFVRFGAPLIVSGLSYFAVHFSDRFVLTSAVSLSELGRYGLAYRFALMVNVLIGDSFAKSWGVSVYRQTGDAAWRQQFARVFAYFTFTLSAAGLAIAVFAPELLRIMVPESFVPSALLVPILVLAYVLRDVADFFRGLLLINKRAVWVGKIALAAALLNLLLNVLLIPAYGTHGAACATLLTWSAYLVVCWIVADREHRLPIRLAPYGGLLMLMVVVYAAAASFRAPSLLLQTVLDVVWIILFVGIAALLFFPRSELQSMVRWLGNLLTRLLIPNTPEWPKHKPAVCKVLLLAYYFPPQNEIGAARPYRFARYLRRLGTPVSVICSPNPERASTPAKPESSLMPSGSRQDRVDGAFVTEPPAIRVPSASAGQTRRIDAISRTLRTLERLLLPYHDRISWLPHACAAASAAMTPGTVLISTHPPVVTHLVALVLKQRFGRPWIADFRDPLWGNPFRTSYRAGLIDPIIERLVVRHADAVIANTDASAAMLVSRYPAFSEKISTIWNGFDPEDRMEPLPHRDRKRRVISHVGSLYGTRTPLPFVACLNRLIARATIMPDEIQFRQIGQSDPDCLDLTNPGYQALQSLGCLYTVAHALPQDEARHEMLTADWLLLLDMNATNSGLQVPAKTFEYIQACRPILALTSPGSPTGRVLARSGVVHACVDLAGDPDHFDAAVLAFLRLPFTDTRPTVQFWSEFDGSRQTAALNVIVNRVYDDTTSRPAKAVA